MSDPKPTVEDKIARKALVTVLKVVGLFGAAWLGANVISDASAGENPGFAVEAFQASALGLGAVILAAPKKLLDKAKIFVAGTLGSFIVTSAVDSAQTNPQPYRDAKAGVEQGIDWVRGLAGPVN